MKSLFALLVSLVFVSSSFAATKAGVTFKDAIKLKKHKLVLNGLGIREATLFNVDVYVAGIYLKKKTKNADAIINSKSPKLLKMQFVRDVTSDQMNEAWDKSMLKAAQAGKFTKDLDRLKKSVSDLKKGDRMAFAFGKGKTYLLLNEKKKAVFKNPRFAKALLNVWFGANPPNEGLKKGMLGLN